MCEESEASWTGAGLVLGYRSNGFSFFLLRLRNQLRGREEEKGRWREGLMRGWERTRGE